jgi:hypothetical protein
VLPRTNQVGLDNSLQRVLEVDVPSYAVAATIDIVLDGTIVTDRSRYLEASFGDNRWSIDDGNTRIPYTEDFDSETQLDR